ncbi:hypothetical protein NPIL_234281 [Nephila pilipes]|uniref:Uncharacterized protein n=1 Tax=Nephila pilipes TaxID=299642 RepID=A0A8X6M9L8_NEPPI|nr:hypothetical protein NPIL_234281 [Nephila pilipes]
MKTAIHVKVWILTATASWHQSGVSKLADEKNGTPNNEVPEKMHTQQPSLPNSKESYQQNAVRCSKQMTEYYNVLYHKGFICWRRIFFANKNPIALNHNSLQSARTPFVTQQSF